MIVVIVGAIVTISLCTFFVVSSSERLHGMKTNAKSFSPTWQPSQTPNTNATNENSSNKSDDLTIILAGVGGGAIFSVGCIYAIIALRQKLQHAKVKIEEIGKEIEGVVEVTSIFTFVLFLCVDLSFFLLVVRDWIRKN